MSELSDRDRFEQDHRWAPEQMSDYLEGELAPTLRIRLERHLAACDECRRLLDGLRRTLEALHGVSGLGERVDPAATVASVRARIGRLD